MTRLKKTITHSVSTDIDIELPYFTKYGRHFYAIISENEVWKVINYDDGKPEVGKSNIFLGSAFLTGHEVITQQEFWEAYSKTMEELSGFPVEPPLFKEEKEVA